MRIDGKAIAAELFENLKKRVEELQKKGITPHVAIVLVGDDPASESYVRQKVLKAEMIGAKATVMKLESRITNQELLAIIKELNNNSEVHGIIIQRPLPKHIDSDAVNHATDVQKDIDAFLPNSPYEMPLAAAVLEILGYIYTQCHPERSEGSHEILRFTQNDKMVSWLQQKNIVVLGKGETGGGPTIELFKKLGVEPLIIDSKTKKPKTIVKHADIIISTVGKSGIIKSQDLKKGVILIGVGMHRGEDGKLHGDYDEEEIKDVASFYTPIPGGVGPVNVAMLLRNLIQATKFLLGIK